MLSPFAYLGQHVGLDFGRQGLGRSEAAEAGDPRVQPIAARLELLLSRSAKIRVMSHCHCGMHAVESSCFMFTKA